MNKLRKNASIVCKTDKNKLKITFLYGKYDWMERETAEDLVEKKVVSGCVYSIPEAGHHLYIENPRECVAKILIHSHSV